MADTILNSCLLHSPSSSSAADKMDDFDFVLVADGRFAPAGASDDRVIMLNGDAFFWEGVKLKKAFEIDPIRDFTLFAV